MFYLIRDAALFDEGADGIPHELTSGPGREHREAFRVHDQQPARNAARLHLSGDNEVGQGEIGRDQDGGVFARISNGIDSLLHHHGSLGIGVDVEPFHKEGEKALALEI